MKITYFRLKGYIKVLNGMGLDEVIIPFNTFNNRVILVQGENGCAKSTIISAMTPNPDSSDSFRTDVIVDTYGNRQIIEYPAEKEIHYTSLDEDGSENYYSILIQSIVDESRTRRTTKAFISKNGEEMNPNGNVTSFKEIRDSLLGIDPIYLDLSSISAENRGIVDMIPSDRRKYMASYIGSLDTYNNIFKVISKKVTTLKSYMNTLNTKIYELGDENELRLKLLQLETSLKELNSERDSLLGELAKSEAVVHIIDPDNKMQDIYSSISERLEQLNLEIRRNQQLLEQEYRTFNILSENVDFDKMKRECEDSIKSYNDRLLDNKNRISLLMSLNESVIKTLESDRTILSGIESNMIQDNIEEAVNSLRDQANTYTNYLTEDDIKTLTAISIDELTGLKESLESFIREIKSAEELHSHEEFLAALEISGNNELEKQTSESTQTLRDKLVDNKVYIANSINAINTITNELEILKNFDNSRPKNCTIDTCPYISKFIELKKSGRSSEDIDKLNYYIEELTKDDESIEQVISFNTHVLEIVNRLNIAFSILNSKKSIIKKIKSIRLLEHIESVKSKLSIGYRFEDYFNILDSLIEKAYIYLDLGKVNEQLKSLESDLKIYKNNKALQLSLTESIRKNELEYSERESEITSLTKDCEFISGIVVSMNTRLSTIEKIINLLSDGVRLTEEKQKLKDEFELVKDKIKAVKNAVDSVNDFKNKLLRVEESIRPLADNINQIKFNLSNIIEYQQEFRESSDKYEKISFIRNACSPGNGMGIQSEYIKRYMNDIIIDCNKVLAYMFNGTIQLDIPIINEKQFSIPFLGPNGIMVPDISNGSTAQKCMIGLVFSCVAMMKSSTKYNIPRFDEVDGGLDQQNRIVFINVLNKVLDFMNSEQCVICSHNMEFDTQSTTRLICSHNGIHIEQ